MERCGSHTRSQINPGQLSKVNQTQMMVGRAEKERPMTEEIAYVGLNVAKSILDAAVSNANETRQFKNVYEGADGPTSFNTVGNPHYELKREISD